MIADLTIKLMAWAKVVPLEMFTFAGALTEEVISPIPSPLVSTLTGALAQGQGAGPRMIIWLAVLSATGKTLGAVLIYIVVNRGENFLFRHWGINTTQIQKVGQYFRGSWRDYLTLITLRALPIMPSLPVSVASGLIKLKLKLYVIASLIGNFLRSWLFIWIGYSSLELSQQIITGATRWENYIQATIVAIALIGLGWIYYRRWAKQTTKTAPNKNNY